MSDELPEGPIEEVPVKVLVTDVSFMNEPLWLGWRRWTWVRLAFIFIVLVGAYNFWREEVNEREIQERNELELAEEEQEDIDEGYQACLRGNDTRQVVTDLVEVASNSPGLNLTGLPSFNDLDPEMQQYLRDLETASQQGSDTETPLEQFVRENLGQRDCEAEYPNHT